MNSKTMRETPNIDDFFKQLDGHSEMPQAYNWDEISKSIFDQSQIDTVFKEGLKHAAIEPAEEMWPKVQQDAPLNLFVKRRLRALSKVAAVVLLGILAFTFYSEWGQAPQNTEQHHNPPTTSPEQILKPMPVEPEAIQQIVVQKEEVVAPISNQEEAPIAEKAKAEEKLSDFEREFGITIDESQFDEILKPLNNLPLDAAFVLQDAEPKTENITPTQNIAFYTNTKLVIAEEHEAEQLIKDYDERTSNK